jgi:hypothetical protein
MPMCVCLCLCVCVCSGIAYQIQHIGEEAEEGAKGK